MKHRRKVRPSALFFMISRKFRIRGAVQGVGYRYFAQRSAARHQVVGYVRNLPDGSVEVHAEGPQKAVDEFKLDLAAGPSMAVVELISETVLEPTAAYSSFRVEK